jgi:hypothetical protein
MAQNEPLALIARGAVELKLPFRDVRSGIPCRSIGERLEREQDRRPGIIRLALLTCQISEKPRLCDLRLAQIGSGLIPLVRGLAPLP